MVCTELDKMYLGGIGKVVVVAVVLQTQLILISLVLTNENKT
jgi:hypothetical protein